MQLILRTQLDSQVKISMNKFFLSKLSESHKNANYLWQNSVSLFITEIIIKQLRKRENMKTILYHQMKLQTRAIGPNFLLLPVLQSLVKYITFFSVCQSSADAMLNQFLKLQKLFSLRENLEIANMRSSGMDGCSTMAGIYHGVRSYFEQCSGHLVYTHRRNHRLVLCLTHLIPKYGSFAKFDSLL